MEVPRYACTFVCVVNVLSAAGPKFANTDVIVLAVSFVEAHKYARIIENIVLVETVVALNCACITVFYIAVNHAGDRVFVITKGGAVCVQSALVCAACMTVKRLFVKNSFMTRVFF